MLQSSGKSDFVTPSFPFTSLPFRKGRAGRTQFGNFIQRLSGLLIGKEELNDHDHIDADPSFLAATGLSATSRCASLCKFENSLNEGTLRAMQKSLRELFIHYSPRNPDVLWVDVDCTPIYVCGNQENNEYSGHYR